MLLVLAQRLCYTIIVTNTLSFSEIVVQVEQMCNLLNASADASEPALEAKECLNDYAPSIVAARVGDQGFVTLDVPTGHPLWSEDLKTAIQDEVASRRDAYGSARLEVVYT